MTQADLLSLLDKHDLRATRPRISVARLLFADGKDRHVTAEWVAGELENDNEQVALATVYNTLHSFVAAGLMRQVNGVGQNTIIFDTNTGPHHHFLNEATGALTDVAIDAVELKSLPTPPDGMEISGVDLIIRVR